MSDASTGHTYRILLCIAAHFRGILLKREEQEGRRSHVSQDRREYITGLRERAAEVYICGEQVKDVTTHPAFRNGIRSIAHLYDMQHDLALQDAMTYASPTTGEPVGLSFIIPRTVQDLERRHTMMAHWARATCGMTGRSPDFMNVNVACMAATSDYCAQNRPEFKQNIEQYYEYIRENDLVLTHTLVNMQRNRSPMATPYKTARMWPWAWCARPLPVVRGPRVLATLGPLADEIAVYPARNHQLPQDAQGRYSFAFAIPCNTPGLKFLCRESLDLGRSHFDHPWAPGSRRWMPLSSSMMCWCPGSGFSCWAMWSCAITGAPPPTATCTLANKWSPSRWSRPSSCWAWPI